MKYIFTTAARNFLPCAKALLKSVREHIPEAKTVFILTDEWTGDTPLQDEGFDEAYTVREFIESEGIGDLGWVFRHDIMELATAVKPLVAKKLLARPDTEWVMFFDPDCVLFDGLPDIQEAISKKSIVVTPHQTEMRPDDKWIFFERNPLKVGTFNLGYFGVSATDTGKRFADWWWERLKLYCTADVENGLFTDQKWVEFVPSYTDDYAVMRHGRHNFARWNSFQRKISRDSDGNILIDGDPAGFIHFSGFYKIGQYVQGLYDLSSERYVDDIHVLNELSRWYANHIYEDQIREELLIPWSFGHYSNGEPVEPAHRSLFRSDKCFMEIYNDPFDVEATPSFYNDCVRESVDY
jgi:hypothetical protein